VRAVEARFVRIQFVWRNTNQTCMHTRVICAKWNALHTPEETARGISSDCGEVNQALGYSSSVGIWLDITSRNNLNTNHNTSACICTTLGSPLYHHFSTRAQCDFASTLPRASISRLALSVDTGSTCLRVEHPSCRR